MATASPAHRLPQYLAAAFSLLILYASLYPFTGWRDTGAPVFAWLTAAWPRYYTGFDLATNVAAYLPFGFLWATVIQTGRHRILAILAATAIAFGLSFAVETLQNFLPSRVSSNVDLGCNTLGSFLGGLGGVLWGRTLLSGGRLHRLRQRWIVAGPGGDAGLVLIALWLMSLLNPETLLFGNGDLRSWLGFDTALPFEAEPFSRIETGVAAANLLALGLILSILLKHTAGQALLALLAVAAAIRGLAFALLVEPVQAFHWVTPGSMEGALIGLIVLVPALRLIPPLRRALAGSALLFATVLVNLAPENPYLAQAAQVWWQGHFLNFNGLTRAVCLLWPFLALPWLLLPERDPWTTSTP